MLKKSLFFDFLNRRDDTDFTRYIADSTEDDDYINWNEYVLPHDYGDAEAEYHAIRNSCALFDVSPIRKIRIRGAGSGVFFDRLLTRPVRDLPAMRATYTVFCNEDGSLKDDAILYKYADDDYLLMPSDLDHTPYFESLCHRFGLGDVAFTECTDSWAGVAMQGPKSATVLRSMGFDEIEQLKPFEVRDYALAGGQIRISRVGFTADLGYECWFKPGLVNEFIQCILSARSTMNIALPGYGLTALQACRLEGGFIVAGWDCATELDPQPGFERSPYELGLGWLVELDGADFVGRDALLAQKNDGHQYVLGTVEIAERIQPEDGAKLYTGNEDDAVSIGLVACSSWSWAMNRTIGNASIRSEYAELENAWIELNGKHVAVKLGRGPFIDLKRRTQVPAPVDA